MSDEALRVAFGSEALDKAFSTALTYSYKLRPITDNGKGKLVGVCVELPYVMGGIYGTPGRAYDSVLVAATATVATMLERGEIPPDPIN